MKRKIVQLFLFVISAGAVTGCLKESEDPNAQINEEIRQIDNYLAARGVPESSILRSSAGTRFIFDSYGDGPPPGAGQTVTYYAVGRVLANGTTGNAFNLQKVTQKIDDVSPSGLKLALRSMLEGTSAVVYLPSQYAYGATGNSTLGVPAHAIIEYNIFIESVEKTTAQKERFELDTATIRQYIDGNSISNVIQHRSGIFYKIEEEGNGAQPTPYNIVTFDYKLRLLSSPNTNLEQNTLTNFLIFDLIDGLKIGFPLLRTGTTATFFIPSGLAYGPQASGRVPANSNLIFEIKLNTISQ